MRHPSQNSLALYAGEDLGFWNRSRVNRHLTGCDQCSRLVEEYRALRGFTLEQQDALPASLNWDSLAREMRANIRVGLAAGACIGPDRTSLPRPAFRWHAAALAAPVLLLVLAGWLIQSWPRPLGGPRSLARSGPVLEATPAGIGYQQDGRSLTLLHPRAEGAVFSTGAAGAVHARYVDSDTGYVTISHVYAE